jgi:hypothetical protein
MELPISNILKRRGELETAQLEDDTISVIHTHRRGDKMAMHGGTAV